MYLFHKALLVVLVKFFLLITILKVYFGAVRCVLHFVPLASTVIYRGYCFRCYFGTVLALLCVFQSFFICPFVV